MVLIDARLSASLSFFPCAFFVLSNGGRARALNSSISSFSSSSCFFLSFFRRWRKSAGFSPPDDVFLASLFDYSMNRKLLTANSALTQHDGGRNRLGVWWIQRQWMIASIFIPSRRIANRWPSFIAPFFLFVVVWFEYISLIEWVLLSL